MKRAEPQRAVGAGTLGGAAVVTLFAGVAAYGVYKALAHLWRPDLSYIPVAPLALFGVPTGTFFVVLFGGAVLGMVPALPEPPSRVLVRALLALNPLLWGGLCLVLWGTQARAVDATFDEFPPRDAVVVDTHTASWQVHVPSVEGPGRRQTSTSYTLVLEYEVAGERHQGLHQVPAETYHRYRREGLPRPFPHPVVVDPGDPTRVRVMENGAAPARNAPNVALALGPLLALLGLWLLARFWRSAGS